MPPQSAGQPRHFGSCSSRIGGAIALAAPAAAAGTLGEFGPHLKRFRLPYVDVSHLIEATEQCMAIVRGYGSTAGFAQAQVNKAKTAQSKCRQQ
jgi:hypothetical protein